MAKTEIGYEVIIKLIAERMETYLSCMRKWMIKEMLWEKGTVKTEIGYKC